MLFVCSTVSIVWNISRVSECNLLRSSRKPFVGLYYSMEISNIWTDNRLNRILVFTINWHPNTSTIFFLSIGMTIFFSCQSNKNKKKKTDQKKTMLQSAAVMFGSQFEVKLARRIFYSLYMGGEWWWNCSVKLLSYRF